MNEENINNIELDTTPFDDFCKSLDKLADALDKLADVAKIMQMPKDWQDMKDILNELGLWHAGFNRTERNGFWEIRVDRGWMAHDKLQSLLETRFIIHGFAIEGSNWFFLVETKGQDSE